MPFCCMKKGDRRDVSTEQEAHFVVSSEDGETALFLPVLRQSDLCLLQPQSLLWMHPACVTSDFPSTDAVDTQLVRCLQMCSTTRQTFI